jgi:hypothetical protein
MRRILIFTALVMITIATGVGAMAAAGEAALPSHSSAPLVNTAGKHPSGQPGGGKLGQPGGGKLCSEIGSITGGGIDRIDGLPQNHLRFGFRTPRSFATAADAQRAARLLCALPAMPPGAYSCPADFGVDYNVNFLVAGDTQTVSFAAAGCETVDGAVHGWIIEGPADFWGALGATLGLPHAGRGTFAGLFPHTR